MFETRAVLIIVAVVFVVWPAWLLAALIGWAVSRRRARRLDGWDRVGLFASTACLSVGIYLGSNELDRASGANDFNGPLGSSVVAERCGDRDARNVEKFQDCWQWHHSKVQRYKDTYGWMHVIFVPIMLLGLCWTPVLIGGWIWRGFYRRHPAGPALG